MHLIKAMETFRRSAKQHHRALSAALRGILCLVTLLFCASSALAGIVFTPHPGYEAPYYFSGANARASYRADITFPTMSIQEAILEVNGFETVHNYYPHDDPMDPYALSAADSIMFDSAFFSSTITVKFRIKADGLWYEHAYSAPAKNMARLFGRNEWESLSSGLGQGATAVNEQLATISYPASLTTVAGWNPGTVQTSMNLCTILYFNTHGSIDHVSTDSDERIYGSTTTPNFETWRNTINGSYVPPFNSSSNPPINLCVFDTCLTGSSGAMTTILSPYYDGYGNLLECQAQSGWTVKTRSTDARELATYLWQYLVAGETVRDAVQDMIVQAQAHYVRDLYDQNLTASSYRVYGDPYTRIHTVYTGNSNASFPAWWRQL